MRMELRGVEDLQAKLETLGEGLNDVLEQAVEWAAKEVQAEAKRLCPVDTGELRNSIMTESQSADGHVEGYIATNNEHAAYIEFGTGPKGAAYTGSDKAPGINGYRSTPWIYPVKIGEKTLFFRTSGQAARPYMYPALKRNEKRIQAEFTKRLRQVVMGD